ncbi:MAG: dienelactone hydrolase family protein [Chloroflexota bacterium]
MNGLIEFGPVKAHAASPAGDGPFPALIVIQEWWGLDEQTRSIADRFAGAGYFAVAPDLYHGERAPLGESEKASLLVRKYGPTAPAELESLFDALKSHPDCNGKVGSVGFCFGGRMSLTLGLTRPLDAVCTFYGGGMQQVFDRMQALKSPVLGLFGDRDQSIPVGTIEQFDKLLDELEIEHEVIVYPNSGHAFFRDRDPSVYKPEAAADAWKRVAEFFAKHLK